MPRSVNEVEDIFLTIQRIFHLYGMTLDSDAALTLKVHIVEHLPLCHLYRVGIFEKSVGKG